jgi:twitching motility protein PilT
MLSGGLTIQRLLSGMKKFSASDLHIKVGIPPTYRIGGTLKAVGGDPLTEEESDHLLDPIIPDRLKGRFESSGDLDFATFNEEGDRFRVNMFRAGSHVNAAIRRVKAEIPTYAALHLPPIHNKIVEEAGEGMVLVVGVTGSGKSSTLAAMIEHINGTRSENIITVEDPVEYRFFPRKSIISQREIGIDVPDYKAALRYVVRQDPDVIFIGELRDHDTVLAAIQAAETGHLVFGSLHTADCMQSFNRILEFFPREEHGFIRSALANTLKAICAQRLLPAVAGFEVSVVPATEVLLNTPIVGEKIREGQDNDIPAIIQSSVAEGMHSFTQSLARLVRDEWVDLRTAMSFAPNRDALDSEVKGLEVRSKSLVSRIRAPR